MAQLVNQTLEEYRLKLVQKATLQQPYAVEGSTNYMDLDVDDTETDINWWHEYQNDLETLMDYLKGWHSTVEQLVTDLDNSERTFTSDDE